MEGALIHGQDFEICDFLKRRLKAHEILHSGRTLFTHLVGTYGILREWDASDAICRAGLCHSVYGTWHFRHQAIAVSERPTIQRLIGPKAEHLVYLFCRTQRPEAFFRAFDELKCGAAMLFDHETASHIRVDEADLRALLHIEAANLLEQGGKISGHLQRILEIGVDEKPSVEIREYLFGACEPLHVP